jgi:predicted regulator of Ras-like GTPase activity (Roadblock/LC7/MglB family)
MSTASTSGPGHLDWLLDQFLERATGTKAAALLSADGLLMGKSSTLSPENAEHISAVASALQSLARGAGRQFQAGGVEQTVVQLEKLYVMVTNAGAGACLATLTDRGADIGLVAYEMNLFAGQVGPTLEPAPRTTTSG